MYILVEYWKDNGSSNTKYLIDDTYGHQETIGRQKLIQLIDQGQIRNARVLRKDNRCIIETDALDLNKIEKENNERNRLQQKAERILNNLQQLSIGTPLIIKVNHNRKQSIFCGVKEVQGQFSYMFFDGRGLDGLFGLTPRYIKENIDNIELIFNENNPTTVAKLNKLVQEYSII